jgi:NADH-quinone oxidoreductase subunit J
MELPIATITFYILSLAMILSSLAVVSVRNPVHSVLFLIFCFFNAAGLFVLIGAEYIAMTLVIVYVGAVAVLFLFVVMMINVDLAEMRQGFLKYLPTGLGLATLFFVELYLIFQVLAKTDITSAQPLQPTPDAAEVTNTMAIGKILYTDYIYAFQLSGIILLVAMIGAIVLTLREKKRSLKQNINQQLARKRSDAIEIVSIKAGEGAS